MKKLAVVLFLAVLSVRSYAQNADEKEIRRMLAAQVIEWNKGNVEGYMHGYWENDSLVFIGKNGPTYGYKATLDRYKKAYPGQEAMGQLTSTIINIKRLSDKYYFIVGKWALERKAGNLSGSYTLLLEKKNRHWMIINDHSS